MENLSLVAIKHEDWPGLEKISALRGFMKENTMRTIAILVGNNGLFLDFELERVSMVRIQAIHFQRCWSKQCAFLSRATVMPLMTYSMLIFPCSDTSNSPELA